MRPGSLRLAFFRLVGAVVLARGARMSRVDIEHYESIDHLRIIVPLRASTFLILTSIPPAASPYRTHDLMETDVESDGKN